MRAAATGVAVVLMTIASACGSDTLDTAEVEQEIQQGLSSPTAEITSVSCPEDVKKEDGKRFTCDAKLEGGGKAQVEVTQTNNRGDVTYAFKPGTLEVSDDAVEPVVEESLAAEGISDAQVDCPSTMKVADGETATCNVEGAGGRTGEITFTWSDDAGSIDESSVEEPSS